MAPLIPPDLPPNPRFERARDADGVLARQLSSYDAMLREERPDSWAAYQSLVEHLRALDVGAEAPRPGDPLPPFALPGDEGRLISSAALLEGGPLVISFNRGNWCPYCWLELTALASCEPEIRANGGQVISITPEVATFSRRLKRRLGLAFPVLTDLDNGYALELGLAFAPSEGVKEVYRRAGIDLGAFQRSDAWFLPIPATLVVDRQGVIREAYVNADFRERNDPTTLSERIAAL